MLATAFSSALFGVDAYLVDVEVDVAADVLSKLHAHRHPASSIALPVSSLQPVVVALRSQQYRMPQTRVLVNLAPADVSKCGPAFDLPIAMGILAGSGQIKHEPLSDFLIIGELSLESRVHGVSGVLPMEIAAREQ